MEVTVVSAVRPKIDAMTAALKAANLSGALDAYEAYDAAWNGIEVYVNFRSKPMYDKLEGDLQNQIEEGLAKPQPDFAGLVKVSEELGQKFDETIALVTNGAPLSPLFDDVTRLRMIRSDLRITTAAIAANNVAKAKAHWDTFKTGLRAAIDLIKVRLGGDGRRAQHGGHRGRRGVRQRQLPRPTRSSPWWPRSRPATTSAWGSGTRRRATPTRPRRPTRPMTSSGSRQLNDDRGRPAQEPDRLAGR